MQLSIFTSAPPPPAAKSTPAMWVGSYYVLKNNGTRKLWYKRFYWQEGAKTCHEHIPGGAVGAMKLERNCKEVQALIDAGQSPAEICQTIRSWSTGRGSNLNRRRFVG